MKPPKLILRLVTGLLIAGALLALVIWPEPRNMALYKVERGLYDFWTRQKPLVTWEEVEAVYESLPRASRQEVDASDYAPWFGEYPARCAKYKEPAEFIRIDRDTRFRHVFRNWCLADFIPWDTRYKPLLWPQYVAIDKRCLQKAQLLFDGLKDKDYDLWAIYIGDGFRTPNYNKKATSERDAGSCSQHMYGHAVDLYLGDVNRDGKQDATDRAELAEVLKSIEARHQDLRSGLGLYENYPEILHYDCRGWSVSWH